MRCCFASTRPVQIATAFRGVRESGRRLCLHTPRADCNETAFHAQFIAHFFASTRPVQIATDSLLTGLQSVNLCLHTPRADCNCTERRCNPLVNALPPHAPCRLQPLARLFRVDQLDLCLHTPRADCNRCLTQSPAPCAAFASTRPVQIATAEMHRIAICTFQNVC